ncbi:MAG: radical SAM protein [Elusimicrobia bacterium]|nr:radical SAM protein [Elusimicrobiota bacterium]
MAARLASMARFRWGRLRGRRMPDEVIFAVTSACNARCDFCYYWEELNQEGPELTLEEIGRIARSMDPFRYLWITGGEPFLRGDLPEIVEVFARTNRISGVHIPTNGLLPDRIRASLERILTLAPGVFVKLLVPLLGPEELHDRLFGVPGAFRRVLSTIGWLGEMAQRRPNLSVSVNTVVSDRNILALEQLLELTKDLPIASHVASPIRGSPLDPGLRAPSPREWLKVSELLLEHNRRHHLGRWGGGLLRRWNVSRFLYQQNTFMRVLAGRGLPFLCAAGDTIAVIESQGEVRICELKERAANLRDYGLDFRRLWLSGSLDWERASVPGCSCTHACFISASLNARPRHFLKSLLTSRLSPPAAV